jgi:RHS repeat-associated protein
MMKKLTLLCFFVHFLCVNTSHGLTLRTFQYDILGNLIELSNADCSRIQYEYDLSNRLVKVVDSDANIFYYHYDSNNNCIAADDRSGSTEYKYDLLNRLTAVAYPGIAPIRYSYDLRGRLEHILYPGGMVVTYAYDGSDRLISVSSPSGKVYYIYDHPTNTLIKSIFPNGITTEYGYDNAKRITSVFHRRADASLIMGFRYFFDGNGNRIRTEKITDKESTFINYAYDKLSRLISITHPNGYEKFTYDELGNRLTKETPKEVLEYQYNSNNQLIKAGNLHFFYDARGNLIKKVSPGKTAVFGYDVHDNLVKYCDEQYEIFYHYDAEGRRIAKIVNGEKTFYINDARSPITQVLIEATAEKQIKACYIYGLSRLSQILSHGSQFYLYDYPDRNVIALSDLNGHLCNQYAYEAFGSCSHSNSQVPNHFNYAGEAYEEETGLVFLRNRYYDPQIGRFISSDPSLGKLINPQSFNPYAYAGNNPINFIDPLGLRSARACAYLAGTVTDNGKSLTGHGFWVLTNDNGEITIAGRYPGSPSLRFNRDKECPGTVDWGLEGFL